MGAKRDLNKVSPDHKDAKYSGPASNKFWRRLNRITNRQTHAMCFEVACALQDIEYRLLRAVEIAEKKCR